MDSREFSEWQAYFEVLQEKIDEDKKEREQQAERDKEAKLQAEITHGAMTASAFNKAKKKK